MIEQHRPSLNKQIISYVSKLFPSGITSDIYASAHGHHFLTLMMANSRKRLVQTF